MRTYRRIAAAGLAAGLIMAAAAPGSADESQTSVTTLTASVSGTEIAVSGIAEFGSESAVEIGQDAVNDNIGGATTAPYGLDLKSLSLSRPTSSSDHVVFTFGMNGLQGGGIPETVSYNWDIAVDGGTAAGGFDWRITTMRTRAAVTQNLEPYGAIFTCVPGTGGTSTCTQNQIVPAAYDEATGLIKVSVPLAGISANPGSTISARGATPVGIAATAAGRASVTNLWDTAAGLEDYVVAAPSVELGLAPAGTPASSVSFTQKLAPTPSGAFSRSVTAPGPGDYDVWARACFGGNCGTTSIPVTVTA